MSSTFAPFLEQTIAQLKQNGVTGSWINPSQAHLTLAFFENISHEKIETLCKELNKSLSLARFKIIINLGSLGVFPNIHRPKVLWIDILTESNDLTRLKMLIDNTLRTCTLPVESRSFKPHLTLARFKPKHNPPSQATLELKSLTENSLLHHVKSLILLQSKLSPQGPQYTELQKFEIKRE